MSMTVVFLDLVKRCEEHAQHKVRLERKLGRKAWHLKQAEGRAMERLKKVEELEGELRELREQDMPIGYTPAFNDDKVETLEAIVAERDQTIRELRTELRLAHETLDRHHQAEGDVDWKRRAQDYAQTLQQVRERLAAAEDGQRASRQALEDERSLHDTTEKVLKDVRDELNEAQRVIGRLNGELDTARSTADHDIGLWHIKLRERIGAGETEPTLDRIDVLVDRLATAEDGQRASRQALEEERSASAALSSNLSERARLCEEKDGIIKELRKDVELRDADNEELREKAMLWSAEKVVDDEGKTFAVYRGEVDELKAELARERSRYVDLREQHDSVLRGGQ